MLKTRSKKQHRGERRPSPAADAVTAIQHDDVGRAASRRRRGNAVYFEVAVADHSSPAAYETVKDAVANRDAIRPVPAVPDYSKIRQNESFKPSPTENRAAKNGGKGLFKWQRA